MFLALGTIRGVACKPVRHRINKIHPATKKQTCVCFFVGRETGKPEASLFVINLGGFFLALAFFLCGHDETPEVVLEGCNVQVANEVYVKYLLV